MSRPYPSSKLHDIPHVPGLYAWYYRPRVASWPSVRAQVSRIFDSALPLEARATLRYGVSLTAKMRARMSIGFGELRIDQVLEALGSREEAVVLDFLRREHSAFFTRPLYIGIASDLRTRVYKQHFLDLTALWEEGAGVSRFLRSNPGASVDEVMAQLAVPHSFALEIRVRGIEPRDLMVYIQEVPDLPPEGDADDEQSPRRSLERVLQLLTDPICGRR